MLTTFDERVRLMENLGVDVLYAMPFDRSVMDMPPEDYVGHLVRQFHPTDVVCGYNHTFGRKGGGTPALLAALGGALGFAASVVPKITLEGQEVSSTAIRGWLRQGDAARARALLGRPYLRQAAVAARRGGRWELFMPPNGKQDVPRGPTGRCAPTGSTPGPCCCGWSARGAPCAACPPARPCMTSWTSGFSRA